MSSYLYVLSIGPVQDFIAAARRTRDLWFGSHLLSEVSKAAAKCILKSGGELIFPAPNDPEIDLEPSIKPDAFNVANIILAKLPEGSKPQEIDEDAQRAACSLWMDYAKEAREKAQNIVRSDIDIWGEQVSEISDIIAFYSAWVPLEPNYKDARSRLMRLLAGRKSIRNFSKANGHQGIPKSSLDGARESVLTGDKETRKKEALRIKLAEGEQLCAVGLTKRLGGGNASFPPVSRIALDPWIRGVLASNNSIAAGLIKEIRDKCSEQNEFSSEIKGYPIYKDFPFDGQVLYPFRLRRFLHGKNIKNEKEIENSDAWEDQLSKSDLNKLELIKEKGEQLQKNEANFFSFGEPDPYLAILVADGDHMGKAISRMYSAEEPCSAEKHKKFSQQLAFFAKDARKIIEAHRGCLVYSGGDDVLSFLPVDRCLDAARKLHERFGEIETPDGKPLTLSVGIAIGHFMEPLEDLLGYGRTAEKAAKDPDRNGLAVHLHTRGGGDPICVREQWKGKGECGLDERLEKWAEMHKGNLLPDKAAFDLRQLAKDYENWQDKSSVQNLGTIIPADAKRLLRRKRPGEKGEKIPENLLVGIDSFEKVSHLAEELVLARKISGIMKQANPTTNQEHSQ